MKKYVLREIYYIENSKTEKEVGEEKTFNNFEELKAYLIKNTNDLFGWINDNVEDYKDYRELPDFKNIETIRDINTILRDYDYDWWKLEVKEEDVDEELTPLIDFINRRRGLWEDLQLVEEELLHSNETLVDWLEEELLTIVDLVNKEYRRKE